MNKATSEGTHRYSIARIENGYPPSAYRVLGRTGLKVSGVGFGTYRVGNEREHSEALKTALLEGCNLIDTSTNYMDGESESCVGHALDELMAAQKIERDQVVVVSKVGYVQGANLREAMSREAARAPYPDMVKYMDGCWHCIHPNFIHDQLTASLKRMNLATIDVYLLHNPEYFLNHTLNTQPELSLDKMRDLYYERITRAFKKLEEEVHAGRIASYGVSSNTFGHGVHEPDFTSLETLWEIACHVAKDRTGNPYEHHFSVVQMPANLLEVGPMVTPNCEETKTTIEYAQSKELGVLINRPLNAIRGNQLVRLAEMSLASGELSLSQQLKVVSELEEKFVEIIGSSVDTGAKGPSPDSLFAWGRELSKANLAQITLEQWKQIELKMIRPQVSRLCSALDSQLKGSLAKKWADWRKQYLKELIKLLEAMGNEVAEKESTELDAIKKKLKKLLPASLQKQSFSRRAIAVLLNVPGIHCVLNGMRETKYVEDSLGALKLERFKVTHKDLEKLAKP